MGFYIDVNEQGNQSRQRWRISNPPVRVDLPAAAYDRPTSSRLGGGVGAVVPVYCSMLRVAMPCVDGCLCDMGGCFAVDL